MNVTPCQYKLELRTCVNYYCIYYGSIYVGKCVATKGTDAEK